MGLNSCHSITTEYSKFRNRQAFDVNEANKVNANDSTYGMRLAA